ncbi:BppU family phage baseplate upper protein [Enterococcus avium]|uniref:BppU family phage baseplate upper protein n=1 Tax=Enterococcus avium TaxID=33945 RepID=UPI0028923F73|nr:BppU family phage baseplate upper protein [Enterococcus avium]MDT2457521.1 BppU family phage baseplate upper protein [Enterococcus avium]
MFKTKQEIIVIQAEAVNPIPTNVVFWSHDHGTAKLIFQLKKDQIFQSLPDGTIVPVCLEFNSATAENGRGKHIYHAVIEDAINGIVSIVLEDNVLGYQGIVDGSIYIELPDSRSLDTAGRFTFAIKRSPIDDSTPELEDYYYQGFEQILSKSKSLIDGVKKDCQTVLDNLTAEVKDLTTQTQAIQQKQADIQEQIDSGKLVTEDDVYLKDETFNKVESSANVIYQVIGKEKAEITFRLDAKSEFVKVSSVGYTTLLSPTNVSWTPLTEEQLNNLSSLDGSLYSARDAAANYMKQLKYDCDILGFFKSLLGEKFFTIRGATTDSQKVEVLESLITDFTSNVYGYGSGGGINKLTHRNWNGTWTVSDSTAANEVTRIGQTIESTDTNWKKLINGGKISVLSNSEPTISPNYSTVNIDYLCLDVTIELSANEHFEYMIAFNQVESIATGEEAEAGESNSVFMTPNLVFKAIAKWVQGKFVSTTGNETILGTKNFQDGIQVKGNLPVLTKSVNDYASVDKNNNASVISDGSMRLYRRGDIVYLTGSFKLSAAKYNQAVWFNVPSWAAPIDRPRMYWSSGSNFYLLAFDPSTINNIICIDNVAQDTWLTGSFCWLARDPY